MDSTGNLQKTMAEIMTERTKSRVNIAMVNDITSEINTRAEQITQSIKNLEKAWEQIDANIESINLDNSVKRQTIETMVQQAQANLQKTMAEIVTEKMRGKLSATQIMDYTSQINTRAEQMAQAWRRVKIEGGNYELNKAKFEVEADKIYQELGLSKKRLDIEEEKLIKEYIIGILQSGVQLYKR